MKEYKPIIFVFVKIANVCFKELFKDTFVCLFLKSDGNKKKFIPINIKDYIICLNRDDKCVCISSSVALYLSKLLSQMIIHNQQSPVYLKRIVVKKLIQSIISSLIKFQV